MLFGVFGLVVVGGLLAATSLQSVPDVIQARKFQVVNNEGKAMVDIFATANGGRLRISSKDGKQVAGIQATADGGGTLGIHHKDGKPVAGFSATTDGGLLSVYNKDGKPVAGIGTTADGYGVMQTFDSTGQVTSQSP